MALKAVVADINTVAEAYRGEYKKVGEEYRLDIDGEVPGFAPKAKVDEFREKLRVETEAHNAVKTKLETLKDIDPEEYKRLKEKKPSETEKEYQERLTAALKPLQDQLATAKGESEKLTGQLSRLRINDAAISAGNEYGLRAGAAVDLVGRVSAVAKLEGDIVVVYDEKGEKRYNTKTGEAFSIKDLVGEIMEKAPYLFEPSTGTQSGGGNGNTGGKGGPFTGPNPYDRKGGTWNLTKQGELEKKDPAKAKQLAAAVGVTLKA